MYGWSFVPLATITLYHCYLVSIIFVMPPLYPFPFLSIVRHITMINTAKKYIDQVLLQTW